MVTIRSGKPGLGRLLTGIAPAGGVVLLPDVHTHCRDAVLGRPPADDRTSGKRLRLASVFDDADALDGHGRDRTHL